jgi:regulator of CtrA degradation
MADDGQDAATNGAETVFLAKTFDDTLALVVDARDYLAGSATAELRHFPNTTTLVYTHEALRLTCRLSHAMAWLLVQRAVLAGEITRADAGRKESRPPNLPDVLREPPLLAAGMPQALRTLLERGRALALRIARLDELAMREDA